ncbi:MAG: RluA family pseudouridine synthase [Brevinematales bacterium]|nr:RluA family pseudouridine synthase [Brevinematales bacterium]
MLKRIVTKTEEGQKIFKYLLRVSDASKIFLYKIFRKKSVLVNNCPVNKDYIIRENDEIFCSEIIELEKENKNKISYLPEVIYCDENVLVIDKKSGEAVYGEKDSVLDKIKNLNKYDFIVPVHRLDRYTEGVLVFALNYKTSVLLAELFRTNRVNKTYESLLHGKLEKELFVEAKIRRKGNFSEVSEVKVYKNIPSRKEWLISKADKSGTLIRPIKISNQYTLCSIEIWTGHHHQIRAVCQAINHPVAGDKKYGAIDNFKHYLLICKKIEIPELNFSFESKKNLKVF